MLSDARVRTHQPVTVSIAAFFRCPRRLWPACLLAILPVTQAHAQIVTDANRMDTVVVTGTRTPHALSDTPVDTQVITRDDIEHSSARNLPQLLRTIPGVSVTNLDDVLGSDNLRLTMRGLQLNEGYGLILVDGRRVHGGLGAHGDYGVSLNQIPLSMIERIEVVKGASSALYGADAMSGVINIITRDVPPQAGGTASLSYGVYGVTPRNGVDANHSQRRDMQAHASYGAPVGASSGFLVAFGQVRDEGVDQNAQPTYRDTLMSRWGTHFDGGWSVQLQGDLARARRETVNLPYQYDREYDDRRLAATLRHQGDHHTWHLSGSRFSQEFVTGYPGFDHGYRFGEVSHDQAETVYTRFGDTHWLTAGAGFQRQDLDYQFNNYTGGTLDSTVPVKRQVDTVSIYVQDEIWLMDQRLILVPGARYEDHSVFGGEFNPKLAASLLVGEATTWRVSVGRAFKSPTIRQLYYEDLYRHGNYYVESNPDLRPETAINANLSVERQWGYSGLWTSAGVFQTNLKDMVVRASTGQVAPDGVPIDSYTNVEQARIQGLELSLRAGGAIGFSLRADAAWTNAENRDTGRDLPYVPEYTLSLIPAYVTPSGRTGFQTALIAMGAQYRNADNTQRVDPHQLVDLRLWRVLNPGATVSLDLNNLFDSDSGDGDFAWRQGRRASISMSLQF